MGTKKNNSIFLYSGSQEVNAMDLDPTTVFETQTEQDPWFSVDLGKNSFMLAIQIDFRTQSFATNFHPVTVSNKNIV